MACLLLSVGALVAFVFWERRVQITLVPSGVWKGPDVTVVILSAFLVGIAFQSYGYYVNL